MSELIYDPNQVKEMMLDAWAAGEDVLVSTDSNGTSSQLEEPGAGFDISELDLTNVRMISLVSTRGVAFYTRQNGGFVEDLSALIPSWQE